MPTDTTDAPATETEPKPSSGRITFEQAQALKPSPLPEGRISFEEAQQIRPEKKINNPRSLAGKAADVVSGAIGDETGWGASGWANAIQNLTPSRLLNVLTRQDPETPFIPKEATDAVSRSVTETAGDISGHLPGATPGFRKAVEGEAKSVADMAQGLINPDVLAGGVAMKGGAIAEAAIKSAFATSMINHVPEAYQRAKRALRVGDEGEIAKSTTDLAAAAGLPLAIVKESLSAEPKPPTRAETLAKEINRSKFTPADRPAAPTEKRNLQPEIPPAIQKTIEEAGKVLPTAAREVVKPTEAPPSPSSQARPAEVITPPIKEADPVLQPASEAPPSPTKTVETPAPEEASPEKVKPSSIDTPAQGQLEIAKKAKEAAWKKVQALRQRVKASGPHAGNSRLELLKAESDHRQAVDMERQAKSAIESRAKELGKTTTATDTAGIKPMTPIQKQYAIIKAQHPNEVVLIRLGDFYEAFYGDAEKLSKGAKVALTSRNGIPMAGVPYHSVKSYTDAMESAGHKVYVSEDYRNDLKQKPAESPPQTEAKEQTAAEARTEFDELARKQIEATQGTRPGSTAMSEKSAEAKMQQGVEQAPAKPTTAMPSQKEVKKTLVGELEKLIPNAPGAESVGSTYDKKSGTWSEPPSKNFSNKMPRKVTISIPGDGDFTTFNTKEHLQAVLDKAKRLQTSSTEAPRITRRGISKEDKEEAERILANPEKDPEVTSMGGLAPGDPNEPVGKNRPPETEGYGGDIYGVAQRVREARAQAGQVAPVESGQGVSRDETIEWGRELLRNGVDAEKALKDFEKTQKFSYDLSAVTRAKGEELAASARRIEEKFGTKSNEYRMAQDALSSWDTRTKPIGTEAHKVFMSLQGETDIDTGTVSGLERAYKSATGKGFTESQAETAKKIADKNKRADAEESEAKKKLYEEAQKQGFDPKIKSIVDRILSFSHLQADAARARIKARAFTFSAGVDPTVLADIAIIGADHILTGATDFAAWSKRMIDEFGEKISPHLQEIFKVSDAKADEITKGIAGAEEPSVKKARASKGPQTLPEIKEALKDHKPGSPFTPEQVKGLWNQVKTYLDSGNDHYGEIRNKIATDLGMSVEEVNRGLTQSKPIKRLADDVWKKQQTARLLKQHAKQWLKDAQLPGYRKALASLPRIAFGVKVFGHGTVALGTHAPMVAFQPNFWPEYLKDFVKMYRMVKNPAFHEMQMTDLRQRKNYTIARRVGLVNDPLSYEDFNNPQMAQGLGKLTGAGDRGYSVLKILRQDMFDKHWDALPESAQLPEVAEAIADGVNHATGVVKSRAFPSASVIAFAPRLEMSRGAWLVVDPVKAANTFLDWKNASISDKHFAINQIKEKATVAATFFSLLAANQALLSATGSKQKVNMTDPMKGDFMKFKVAGMQLSYGNPMITMMRLPVRLYKIRESDGGKLKNLVYPDESSYTVLGEYARSQLSPFSSLVTDLWLKSDWMNRPLPNSTRPVPKRLRDEGVKPYTWAEFGLEQTLPIPAEEALREVWKDGFHANSEQIAAWRKALASGSVMIATGARLNDDWDAKDRK